MTPVGFGVAVPQTFLSGEPDLALVREWVTRAEALGVDTLWVEEQTSGAMPILGPVPLLAYVAALTTRARLGAAVLLTGLGSPVHFARDLSTLDHLCGGRLDIGLGTGEATEYARYALPVEPRGARFTEMIQLMKRLWTERRVTFEGEHWRYTDVTLLPSPVQRPHPPIYFGGRSNAALRRTVALGDGFIGAGATSTADFAAQVVRLRSLLTEAGRDPATVPIGKRIYLHVAADHDRALAKLRAWFKRFYGDYIQPEEVAIWGDAAECADRMNDVVVAGADFLVLNPVADDLAQLDLLDAHVRHRLVAAG